MVKIHSGAITENGESLLIPPQRIVKRGIVCAGHIENG